MTAAVASRRLEAPTACHCGCGVLLPGLHLSGTGEDGADVAFAGLDHFVAYVYARDGRDEDACEHGAPACVTCAECAREAAESEWLATASEQERLGPGGY